LDEALEFINERPDPLAVYLFSSDERIKKRGRHSLFQYGNIRSQICQVRENTLSGGFFVNDTFYQLASMLSHISSNIDYRLTSAQSRNYQSVASALPAVRSYFFVDDSRWLLTFLQTATQAVNMLLTTLSITGLQWTFRPSALM
jgi:hypothetical protein